MTMRERRYSGWVLAVLCLLLAGWTLEAWADDAPARSARLSFLQGSVTVGHADNTGSDPAEINMPLAQGTSVVTGQDGQAEIEFEDGSLVRLTPNSSLQLTALAADANGNMQTALTLSYGLAYAELRAAAKFAYAVDAGGIEISPVTNTTVRIAMDQPPPVVSVLDGTAQVNHESSAGGESYRTNVNANETLTADAGDPGRYSLTQQVAENSWDAWNNDRDAAAANEAANQTDVRDQYAGEAGYGWSDLDANGSWYDVPGQGPVWQPNVALDPGFDPYGYGSWVWYPGMGYVWASGYAWGWTPFRCGSWSYWDGFGWGWYPGNTCGSGGWGFGGGGYVINIVRPPRDYRYHRLPSRGPGGFHPIRIGHPVTGPVHRVGEPRTIAGRTVEPLRPRPVTAFRGGAHPAGGALRRDFPVDRASHQPVLGRSAGSRESAPAATVRPGLMHPVAPRTGAEGREAPRRPEPTIEQRQSRPQPETRPVMPQREQPRPMPPQRPMPQSQRPMPSQQQGRPAPQHYEPQAQPRYAPPQQPRYSPPPQPHYAPPPRFSPPPQPRYSPPPQPHYAPPPSAPRSAPAPSSRR